jgi:hypothetical protein
MRGASATAGRTVNRLLVRHRDRTVAGQRLAAKNATVQRDACKSQDLSDESVTRPNRSGGTDLPVDIAASQSFFPERLRLIVPQD